MGVLNLKSLDIKIDLLKCVRNELVPENPYTKSSGIKGLLEYRINSNNNKRHPDSIYEGYDKKLKKYYGRSKTAECFEKIYNINPFDIGSSDTIFNCWSFLNRFVRGKTGKDWVSEKEVLNNLDKIFNGYEDVKKLLDKLADYHHSLANFMPAPYGFNGSASHDGKGQHDRDNDMPDVYYKRAEKEFPYMYKWINNNIDKYCLHFFKKYKSNLSDGIANSPLDIKNNDDMEKYKESIRNAIRCIEERAKYLTK